MVAHEDLPYEKVTNRAYLNGLEQFRSQPIQVGVPRSGIWLDEQPSSGIAKTRPGCLAGRVGLDIEDEFLGSEFYVGVRFLSDRYFPEPVVGWDAPVAKIFYDPDNTDHELLEHVRVRRTLSSHHKEIVHLDDDWAEGDPGDGIAFSSRELKVAQPPRPEGGASRRRGRHKPDRIDGSARSSSGDAARPERVDSPAPPEPKSPSSTQGASDSPNGTLRKGMRSAGAVERALTAPREEKLTSLLATLQPDQYRLITKPAATPLIVQGHPGTGKTIIAVHRAAYLVSGTRGDDRVKKLLFLGPSNTWAIHVNDALKSLAEEDVTISGMETFYKNVIGSNARLQGGLDYAVDEVCAELFPTVKAAAQLVGTTQDWATGRDARLTNISSVYTALRYGSTTSQLPLGIPPALEGFFGALPSFGGALTTRRLQPLLASIAIALYGPPKTFGHVIVDEAQDISPVGWQIIRSHTTGSLTIVGDMNQRRNDVGHSSWEHLIDQLRLADGPTPIAPEEITRGYRSTQAILDFAKPLLPKEQRNAQSLQTGGISPTVRRSTTARDRDRLVEEELVRLCGAYPEGQLAVIVVKEQLDDMKTHLLKNGWKSTSHHRWTKGAYSAKVLTPTTARGVEFDGVVVVEPGAFPRNLGRVGQLYTSLTRANRELSVVHYEPLPDELRKHARRR